MCDLFECGSNTDLPPIEVSDQARRRFLAGLGALPLAAVLAYPELASAAAGSLETVSLTPAGGSAVQAALAVPENATDAPAVLLIHEWWGLNDQVKSVAAEFANLGYIALAVDLYGGVVASDREGAMAAMRAVDPAAATATLVGWVDYLRNHENSNGKVATIGWCFGGGWSLKTSIATPVDGTVIYYGNVEQPADRLKNLSGPVLGHFGTLDQSINADMVGGFEAEMEKADRAASLSVHWYEANHAFANPTGARYDEQNAALAWDRTLAFLKETIG